MNLEEIWKELKKEEDKISEMEKRVRDYHQKRKHYLDWNSALQD